MFATNNSILIKAHPREMQGRVLGLSVAATYAGLTLGPALGGVLNRTLGWKAIFILSALYYTPFSLYDIARYLVIYRNLHPISAGLFPALYI